MSHPFPIISSRDIPDQIQKIFSRFFKKIVVRVFWNIEKIDFYDFLNSEESLFELGENQIETAMGITIDAASVCPEGTNEVLEKESENMSNTFGVKLRKKSRFGQDLERSGSKRRSGIQNDTGKIQFPFMKNFKNHKMTLNWPQSGLVPDVGTFIRIILTRNDLILTQNNRRTSPKSCF